MMFAKIIVTVTAVGLLSAVPASADFEHLGRQALGPRDGWAAATTGTTGGSKASRGDVHFVDNRSELLAAAAGNTPKIIYVRSQANQARRVMVPVGANTTIVGLGDDATLLGLTLRVAAVDNVIIRNLRFEDSYDCFPQWDPTDGPTGNWNSEYDNLVVTGSTHVWIDRCEFSDGGNTSQPEYFGRKYEVHDGLLDVVNGADLVTLSYNHFHDHDKSLLIGSTDRPTYDVGKLRVTLHHNLFENLGSRTPRVRYGQVHIYNNLYVIPEAEGYEYSWGVGFESRIYAQNNYFRTGRGVNPSTFAKWWNGTVLHAAGTLVNGHPVDVVAAHNAAFDPDLGTDVGWTPTLVARLDPAGAVPRHVRDKAGPREWFGRHTP